MIKRCFFAFFAFAFLTSALHAQATPAATRTGILQVGGGITNANSDYAGKRISGITVYSTFDFFKNLGVEANIHYVSLKTPEDFGENTYEAGLRYVYRHGRFEPYARGMAGIGTGDFQAGSYINPHTVNYGVYSFGGGLDIRLGHHINLRAIDYERQFWPTFPPNNLTPGLITVGVAYRLR